MSRHQSASTLAVLLLFCSALFAAPAAALPADDACSPKLCLQPIRLAAAPSQCRRLCVDLTLRQAAVLLRLTVDLDEAQQVAEEKRASYIRMGKKAAYIRMGRPAGVADAEDTAAGASKKASYIRMGKKASYIRMG